MTRKNRVKLTKEDATYHVMTRTVLGEFLFKEAEIKEWMYRRILHLANCYHVELHAMAVLSNHYHIVLTMKKPEFNLTDLRRRFERLQAKNRFKREWSNDNAADVYAKLTDLSEFMKDINQTIAFEINRRRENRGHVWGGRFKSVLIEDGAGLLACLAYVELNPVRAGLCDRPSNYRWCSAGRFKLGGRRAAGVKIPKLKNLSEIKRSHQQQAFNQLVDHMALREQGVPTELPKTWREWNAQLETMDIDRLSTLCFNRTCWAVNSLVLGSQSFCQAMVMKFGLQRMQPAGPKTQRLIPGIYNGKERTGAYLN